MPLEVFYSYAHEDEKLRNELDKHLRLLQRQNLIFGWHDRRIGAGTMWGDQIDEHIHSAHIILLLISPDFIASQYCYEKEMEAALARHSRREALVIPIILRPVNWKGAPFGHLQALPRDTKPVTTWANQDEAFAAIADEIREVVLEFQSRIPAPIPVPTPASETSPAIPAKQDGPKERMLDAAIASHIVKGEPTDLLVLIRLPDSPGLRGVLAAEQDSDARPEDVLSKKFSVTFPRGFDGDLRDLKVAVEITSPDFLPPRQSKNILVPPDADSDICGFILTPTRVGSLKVLVELQWEDVMRGQRRLVTECLAEAVPQPTHGVMNVVRMPIAVEMAPVRTFGHNAPDPAPPQTGSIRIKGPIGASGSDDAPPDTIPPPISLPPRIPEAAEKASRRAEADQERREYASPPAYRNAPMLGLPQRPPPASAPQAAKRSRGVARIMIAFIALFFFLGAYWQFVYKPRKAAEERILAMKAGRFDSVTFSGRVLNARTKESVPNASVTLTLVKANGAPASFEQSTDSNGAFHLLLKAVKPGTSARVSVRADNFAPFEENIVLSSFSNTELPIVPAPTR
jgi:hypothetical protein